MATKSTDPVWYDAKEEPSSGNGGGGSKKKQKTERELIQEAIDRKELVPLDLDPNYMQWSEALKAKLFGTADKDGNYFSYLFLDKIFGESRPCKNCGTRGGARLPDTENTLKLYVIEEGIIGKHDIQCTVCKCVESLVSGEDPSLLPKDPRLEITGADLRELCKKITHFEVLHDIMEMLQIAAIEDQKTRRERHYDIAEFMICNARRVCEEWCRPENADLRQKKFLRLREEALLTRYKPTFTPDTTEEYREMYDMMATSFRENREKMRRMLCLMKSQLIDNPSRSSFMTWVGIAMFQSENYEKFKTQQDLKNSLKLEAKEFQSLKDNYLSLEVPLGIKKIPMVFMLFEVPRFFHYCEFVSQRLGKKKSKYVLTEKEKEQLELVKEEYAVYELSGTGRRGKTKTMVSPEAHLTLLSIQEEMDRERLYKNCREKREKESDTKPRMSRDRPKAVTKEASSSISPLVASLNKSKGKQPAVDALEDEALSKAQLKRRRKKALMVQKKEEDDEEREEYSKEGVSWDELAKRRNSEVMEELYLEDKVRREMNGLDKGSNSKKTIAEEDSLEKEEEKVAAKKKEKVVARANEEKVVPKKEVKVATPKNEKVLMKNKDKDDGNGEDANVLTVTRLIPSKPKTVNPNPTRPDPSVCDDDDMTKRFMDCENIVLEAAKSALAKKKAARGVLKEKFVSSLGPEHEEAVEELAVVFANCSMFRGDDGEDDGGIRSLERFISSCSLHDGSPFPMQRQVAGAFGMDSGDAGDSRTGGGNAGDKASAASQPRVVVRYPEPPGSQASSRAAPNEESSLAKSAHGVPSVKTISGIMGAMAMGSEKSSDSKAGSAGGGKQLPKVVANQGGTRGEECIAKLAEKLSGPTLHDSQMDAMLNDLSSLSSPVLNDTVFQSEEGLGKTKVDPKDLVGVVEKKPDVRDKGGKKKGEARGSKKKREAKREKKTNGKDEWTEVPEFNRHVSVLADPFGIARTSNLPTKGALTFYMQESSNARSPVDKKFHSAAEKATQNLLDLVKNATRGNVQHHCDCNFHLVEFETLPTVMRRMATRENTGAVLENVEITAEEFREVLIGTKGHGKRLFYSPGEPVTRLMILCFPLELGLPMNSLINLGRDVFGVTQAIAVTYQRDSLSGSDSEDEEKKTKVPEAKSRNESRRAKREALRIAKKARLSRGEKHAIMVTQMDAHALRARGHKIKEGYDVVTVLTNEQGVIIKIVEDKTPEEVRAELSRKYTLVAEKHGYYTLPGRDRPDVNLMDAIPTEDKIQGNRKKQKSKKKVAQDVPFPLQPVDPNQSKSLYTAAVGRWASGNGDWPKGLPFGTDNLGDRKVICGPGDDGIVEVLVADQFGNHSMLKHVELSTLDAPNDEAAEKVMARFMEPPNPLDADDPTLPRVATANHNGSDFKKKLPLGTKCSDIPGLMKKTAPHNRMRAMDALRTPYKFELTVVLTPPLDDNGDLLPDCPKRIALFSKLTLEPKNKYDIKQFEWPLSVKGKEKEKEEKEKLEEARKKKREQEIENERKRLAREEEKRLKEEEERRREERREMEEREEEEEEEEDVAPKLSKSKRKKLKKKMKEQEARERENEREPDYDQQEKVDKTSFDAPAVTSAKVEVSDEGKDVEMKDLEEDEIGESDAHAGPKIAREKFKFCDNCGKQIDSRIMLCAGCKRVAYCNYGCQKAKWKVHKKVCAYALRKDGKESTG